MTAKQVQIRRDSATNLSATTPASGELGYDTTNKRVVVGDGTTPGGIKIPSFSDIQKQGFVYATVGGTANDITLTCAPAVSAYTAGLRIVFKATANNTTAVRYSVNGIGLVNARKIKNGALAALEADDHINGGLYEITHDGTQFQVKGLDEASEPAGWTLLAVATGGGTSYDFTTGISAAYRNYAFVLENVLPATSLVELLLRTRRTGQGSFDNTNYSFVRSVASATSITTNSSGSGSISLINNVANSGSGTGVSGNVFGYHLAQSGSGLISSQVVERTTVTTRTSVAGGANTTSVALDGVQFLFSSGNISSGDIYMYGMRSSL